MTAEREGEEERVATGASWPRHLGRALLVLLALLAIGLAVLWTQREAIATDAIDRELAKRGVRARYRIGTIGIGRQRLEKIVIGDPANPDLTAEVAEVQLAVGTGGVSARSIVAEGVRLHGRLVEGRVTLGEVDKLLPAPSGAPFTLPDLRLTLTDARVRLETPMGQIGLAIDGRGNLSDGFSGQVAAVAPRLVAGGCRAARASAFVHLAITERKPVLDGPVRAASIACAGVRLTAPRIAIDAMLPEALDAWRGTARVEADGVAQGAHATGPVRGNVTFDGNSTGTQGMIALAAAALRGPSIAAGGTSFEGRYRVGAAGGVDGSGRLAMRAARVPPSALAPLRTAVGGAAGTPVGPIAAGIGDALVRAAEAVDLDADVALIQRDGGLVRVSGLEARSRSGTRTAMDGQASVTYGLTARAARIDGRFTIAGGGLPDVALDLHQPVGSSAISGTARVSSMSTTSASLALGPVSFGPAPGGGTRFATAVTMSGPLGGGTVTGLSTPLAGRFDPRGGFRIGDGCQPLGFSALEIAGMRFGATRLPLCPLLGGAILAGQGGRLRGGVRIANPRLAGRLGSTPLSLAAASLSVPIDRPGFAADALRVRLGAGGDPTRLDLATIAGRIDAEGIGGRYTGAAGKIANVPLLISNGAGPWRLDGGRITLGGALEVADEAASPRFRPLTTDDFALRFADSRITATGTLREPRSGVAVSTVDIVHRLGDASGRAILDVRSLAFGKSLQPDALTPLALGVVANVEGLVSGRGEIRWNGQGVTSDGVFRTDGAGLNLAAAFGPVSGLKGEIIFTDLLGLVTAPEQVATLAEVNPGVAVTDGVVRYRLLADQRIRIEEGRWPFSGGLLVLEPTTLDMGAARERRLTFRVEALDAGKFIEHFDVPDVDATGLFDGTLPMVFDQDGGRIVGGRIVARPEGGTLAYVGDVSNADLGMFAKMAFDALKRMRYRNLAILFDGAIDGEIVSSVIFTGNNELPVGGKAPGGIAAKFIGLPFKFNIVIKAPFRGLLGSMRSFTDPGDLIRSQLPDVPVGAVVTPSAAPQPAAVQPQVTKDRP